MSCCQLTLCSHAVITRYKYYNFSSIFVLQHPSFPTDESGWWKCSGHTVIGAPKGREYSKTGDLLQLIATTPNALKREWRSWHWWSHPHHKYTPCAWHNELNQHVITDSTDYMPSWQWYLYLLSMPCHLMASWTQASLSQTLPETHTATFRTNWTHQQH